MLLLAFDAQPGAQPDVEKQPCAQTEVGQLARQPSNLPISQGQRQREYVILFLGDRQAAKFCMRSRFSMFQDRHLHRNFVFFFLFFFGFPEGFACFFQRSFDFFGFFGFPYAGGAKAGLGSI